MLSKGGIDIIIMLRIISLNKTSAKTSNHATVQRVVGQCETISQMMKSHSLALSSSKGRVILAEAIAIRESGNAR